jgi:ATP-dependent RNA helicase DOB1
MPCPLRNVAAIAQTRITLPKNLMAHESRVSAMLSVVEVINRFPEGVPLVDPEIDMGIQDAELAATRRQLAEVQRQLAAHPMAKCTLVAEVDGKYKVLTSHWSHAKYILRVLTPIGPTKYLLRVLTPIGPT